MILDDIKDIVAKQLNIDASTITPETSFYDLEADNTPSTSKTTAFIFCKS